MSDRFKSLTIILGLCMAVTYGAAQAETPPPTPPPTRSLTVPCRVANLTPKRLNATRPLLRKINAGSSVKGGPTRIDSAFCSGLSENEEREVAVPDFEWGVVNDNCTAINTAFSVTLSGGPTGAVVASATPPLVLLSTQPVASIPKASRRTFKNWIGRPARVNVVNVTGAPLLDAYQNTAGCYLPNPLGTVVGSGNSVLDPKPLVIRVDSANQITERVETDNELIVP